MEALKTLYQIIKEQLAKVLIVFILSGIVGVLGIVPGTENVSNVIGNQINSVKAQIGTAVSPTVQ